MRCKGLNSFIMLIAWEIWKHRNSCVFDENQPNTERLLQVISDQGMMWKMATAPNCMHFPLLIRQEREFDNRSTGPSESRKLSILGTHSMDVHALIGRNHFQNIMETAVSDIKMPPEKLARMRLSAFFYSIQFQALIPFLPFLLLLSEELGKHPKCHVDFFAP